MYTRTSGSSLNLRATGGATGLVSPFLPFLLRLLNPPCVPTLPRLNGLLPVRLFLFGP